MKRIILFLLLGTALNLWADKEIHLLRKEGKGDGRNEVNVDPQASYDENTNEVIISIEATRFFEMRVIDIYGTVVYTCPVLMVDGTPTNYQLPELPAGIYTLKVESEGVSYEGTLVIE